MFSLFLNSKKKRKLEQGSCTLFFLALNTTEQVHSSRLCGEGTKDAGFAHDHIVPMYIHLFLNFFFRGNIPNRYGLLSLRNTHTFSSFNLRRFSLPPMNAFASL